MEVMKSKTAEIINEGELTVASMEFRIKEEASLAGKLQRKGSKYGTLRDITDIFGGRIIMYYNELLGKVAQFPEYYSDPRIKNILQFIKKNRIILNQHYNICGFSKIGKILISYLPYYLYMRYRRFKV